MVGTASLPQGFQESAKRVVLESQQAMIAAVREERYEDALECAEKALAVDPGNAMVQQFRSVLEDKVRLDETASEDEDEDEDEDGQDSEGEESEGEESEGEESEGEESEDEVYDEEEPSPAQADGSSSAPHGSGSSGGTEAADQEDEDEDDSEGEEEEVEYPDAIVSAPSRRLKMSSAERRKLKSALAKQVYELQILQKMEQEGSLIAGI